MLRHAILQSSHSTRRLGLLVNSSRISSRRFGTKLADRAPLLKDADTIAKGNPSPEFTHPRDEVIGDLVTHPKSITKPTENAVSFPSVTGDWVLFHPVYTLEETSSVKVLNRKAQTLSDYTAALCVRLVRIGFDLFSGYRHKEIPAGSTMSLKELREKGFVMNEQKWLLRIVFLETVAGVPGMVAASLRHLRSLRLMRRDAGWIHTLLEESENERMHLMTFMTLKKPSIWFRAMVLGAQGVFYNAFFIGYLLSPKTAHRFVGGLEEEAVLTYTRLIDDIENGRFPEWENKPAPSIAIDYWRLSNDAKLLDVIKAVRADEATHRFVNHSLASLNQAEDVNPFALREADMKLKGTKICLERSEATDFVRDARRALDERDGVPPASMPLEKPSL